MLFFFIKISRFKNNIETKIKTYFIKWCNVVLKQIQKQQGFNDFIDKFQ